LKLGQGACNLPSMTDGLSTLYQDLLGGSYDCVDRIVLNAYFRMGHDPGMAGLDPAIDQDTHRVLIAFGAQLSGYQHRRFGRAAELWRGTLDLSASSRGCRLTRSSRLSRRERTCRRPFRSVPALPDSRNAPAAAWRAFKASGGKIINPSGWADS